MTVHRWTLAGDHTAAAQARAHVQGVLATAACADDAVHIASELAANAVGHGRPPVELVLDVTDERVRITVSSVSAGAPAPRTATLDDVRGRGLAIVTALSSDWGWRRDDDRLLVWAELSTR